MLKLFAVNARFLEELNLTDSIYPLSGYGALDSFLRKDAALVKPYELSFGRYLKIVVFAYVLSPRGRIMAVKKSNGKVLGIGRCRPAETASSPKRAIIEQPYNELDLFMSVLQYTIGIAGLIHRDDREYDRQSPGCPFEVQLICPCSRRFLGEKFISIEDPSSIAPEELIGWSRQIHWHLMAESSHEDQRCNYTDGRHHG
jgi:hypothetical protein